MSIRKISYLAFLSYVLLSFVSLVGCQPMSSDSTADESKQISVDPVANSEPKIVARPFYDGDLVDLTHSFDKETIYWPTADSFRFTEQTVGETPGGYFYAANSFATAEHGGTHIDAPIHFAEDRQTVDKIPLRRLMGEGVVIDVSEQCAMDPDYLIGIEDLRGWEERHERQLVDVIVLLRTGYGKQWTNRKKYLGTEKRGPEAVKELHFPGLHPDAARWLAEHRLPKMVGIDTASIDHGPSRDFQSHVTLFKHNIPALENVANLDELPEVGFQVIALPMKIGDGSGGPTRIVAILPRQQESE